MKTGIQKYLAVLAAAFIGIVPHDTVQASVQFKGVSGSCAASDGQLAGGQSFDNWTIEYGLSLLTTASLGYSTVCLRCLGRRSR